MRKPFRLTFWVAIVCLGAGLSPHAQWLHSPTANAPRTRDGKVDVAGPVRKVNGKPDLSGVWQVRGEPRAPDGLYGLGESLNSKYFRDILSDFKPDERPLTPAGAARLRANGVPGVAAPALVCLPEGVPHGNLQPQPFKIFQLPNVIVILYEVGTTFRQVFMDGRKFPPDPSPSWQGYSVGRWEGDTLVVDTIGFNDRSWLDRRGTPHSEKMRVEERFRRRDFGHLELTTTITDPETFTKPITYSVAVDLMPDTDLFEHYCQENELDDQHMPGRARK